MTPETTKAKTLDEVSRSASNFILDSVLISLKKQHAFSLVLAGGNTPLKLYEYLAEPPISDKMPWRNIHIFFGDERWVASDHIDSNYSMAYQNLLSKVQIPSTNIHQIPTNLEDPESGAVAYEKVLNNYFTYTTGLEDPSFDMILLGMGIDGHTASLFPSSPALEIKNRLVAAVPAVNGIPAIPRITLTLPVINNAKHILFLIAGYKKQNILQEILNNTNSVADRYPAARIQPKSTLKWFIADQ